MSGVCLRAEEKTVPVPHLSFSFRKYLERAFPVRLCMAPATTIQPRLLLTVQRWYFTTSSVKGTTLGVAGYTAPDGQFSGYCLFI